MTVLRPKLLCILFSLFIAQSVFGAAVLQPFSAVYRGDKRVFLFAVKAQTTLMLERQSRFIRYTSRSEINWSFYRRKFYDCSILRVEENKLYPVEYIHKDLSDKKYDVQTRFNWSTNQAVTLRGDKSEPVTVDITWPTWDPLSLQVAMIVAAQTLPTGSVQPHRAVERGKLREYQIRINGENKTNTAFGHLRLVEVSSEKHNGSGRLVLAPEYQWLPVVIEIDDIKIELQNPPELGKVIDTGVPTCETR